jgi:hypothetical protein
LAAEGRDPAVLYSIQRRSAAAAADAAADRNASGFSPAAARTRSAAARRLFVGEWVTEIERVVVACAALARMLTEERRRGMNRERALNEAERARLGVFIAAAQAAVVDWVSAEVFATAQYAAPAEAWSTDRMTAWLPLRPVETTARPANLPSRLAVALRAETAREFAERVFVEVGLPADPNAPKECVAELANLVAGRAKALFYGTPEHFSLGTPTFEPPPAGEYLVAVLAGEFGELVVATA